MLAVKPLCHLEEFALSPVEVQGDKLVAISAENTDRCSCKHVSGVLAELEQAR